MERLPIVGRVIDVNPHPNADHLYLADVNVGQGDPIRVIFGGDRILEPGNLVPVALPGTYFPNGEKIRPRNYRGIKSYAELLSSDELGWTVEGLNEVFVLEDSYQVGDTLPFLQAEQPN